MTNGQKITIALLSMVALILLAIIGVSAYQSYQSFASKPLGPVLPFAGQTLPPTWTASPGDPASHAGLVTLVPTISFTTDTPEPFCGGAGVMNILVIGTDTRADNYIYGLADAIRIVRVDFSAPKVTVLDFPRALWVEIPHISDNLHGQDHELLNQAYLYGQPGFKYWDDPSGGPGLLAETLNINFGIKVDHYVSVNMRTFVNIINAVDGVDISIPDKSIAYFTGLPIGDHHLNGDQALKVARNRTGGILERTNNQNIVLCALREKLTSPKVVTQIPGLIQSFQDNIITDFTPAQLGQLACLGTKLPRQNIILTSFPPELFTQARQFDPVFDKDLSVLDADFDVLRDYSTRFQSGVWPQPPVIQQPSDSSKTEATIVCK